MVKAILLTLLLAGCSSAPTADRNEKRGPIDADSVQKGELVPPSRIPNLNLACCIHHFIDSAGTDTSFRLLPIPRRVTETEILLEEKNTVSRWHGPKIQKWLSLIDSTRLVAYSVHGVKGKYKVLTAPYFHPTGLATNFTHWLVLKNYNQFVVHFQSLLDMPNAAFLRRGSRSFEILTAELSGYFYHSDRDWDKLSSYKWLIYSFEEQKVQQREVSIADCLCEVD